MKIAIHKKRGFTTRWIEYCENNKIPYKLINGLESNVIQSIRDCDALVWHYYHNNYAEKLAAQKILFALEHSGIKTFPNFHTAWHFDDKVAQKYLLEAIGAPLVPSYVFYDKAQALTWVNKTTYPKVFKLKGGAGSANVKLIKTKNDAIRLVNKAFGKGFSQFDRIGYLKERFNKFKNNKDTLYGVCKGIGRLVIPTNYAKMQGREKGYVYFQDFIPNNTLDTRIVIIGDKALGERRFVRKNDFRASGSGSFSYEGIDLRIVKIAFEVSERLKLQSVAFDFIFDPKMNPLIVEMSYGFGTSGIRNAPGYWDANLRWNAKQIDPEAWILETMLETASTK